GPGDVSGKAKRRHLSLDEFREISRRPEGSQHLTQPHSVTRRHSNSDPNPGGCTPQREREVLYILCILVFFLLLRPETEEALATPMKEVPEDEKVDYLEGLTTDIFGDDKEFERCWSDPDPTFMNHHEEAEALPDALYCLLGSSRGLSHPQGFEPPMCCIHYFGFGCVFGPWKKLYYRYTKKEIDAVKEINAILENHRIIKDDQEMFLFLFSRFMAQYKPSQRVKTGAVLQSVRTHRLFPQAEACITQTHKKWRVSRGYVAPHILCDGATFKPSAFTEYLSAMATMLLAVRRNDINISNRLHYIFYVLHLMENTLPTILNHDIHRDHVPPDLTGKTTTLIWYSQQRPHLHMAFNKSVATQAQRRFPSNVDCRMVNSMAFGSALLPKGSGGFVNVKVVTLTLNAYMASADTHITPNHVPNTHGTVTVPDRNAKRMFARDAQKIWDKMVALEVTREYAYHMNYDGYLKQWQLRRPTLDKYDVLFIDEAQDCTPAIMDIMLPQHCGKILVGDPHQQIYTFRGSVNALNLVEHTHLYYLTQVHTLLPHSGIYSLHKSSVCVLNMYSFSSLSIWFGSEIAYIGATILQVCKKV
uniref:UvrD-like helicase ATP-binding domain-containing protein n=1 Tax=Oncorhynchus tshawytscha TaxID=74940 RepID=A0A8C8EZB7_ONCTS